MDKEAQKIAGELPQNPYVAYTEPTEKTEPILVEEGAVWCYEEQPTTKQIVEMDKHIAYKNAQQDMIRAGFRRVICPECGQVKDEDRVKNGMKCEECAGYTNYRGE